MLRRALRHLSSSSKVAMPRRKEPTEGATAKPRPTSTAKRAKKTDDVVVSSKPNPVPEIAKDGKTRCAWSLMSKSPDYVRYHDEEWGNPVHDDKLLFEFLVLESFQAGLSWATILAKREEFRHAFDEFDAVKISGYGAEKVEELLQNAGIVRHRGKIQATIGNAKAFLQIQKEFGSFDKYVWRFVNDKPILNSKALMSDIATYTPDSDAISKDLSQRGMKFVGTKIIYAWMQACGLVNDHTTDCFCYPKTK